MIQREHNTALQGRAKSGAPLSLVVRLHEELALKPSIVSGLSAVLGSLSGGGASIVTAWFTQRAQSQREAVHAEIRKRELVYTEFISECSKLAI
jgi:hypothetical protein